MNKYLEYINKLTGVKWNCENDLIYISFKDIKERRELILNMLKSNNITYHKSIYDSSLIFINQYDLKYVMRDDIINKILNG